MGRGLSELQKAILRLAYYNHVREDIPNPLYTVRASCPLPDSPKPLLGLQMGELVALAKDAVDQAQGELRTQLQALGLRPLAWMNPNPLSAALKGQVDCLVAKDIRMGKEAATMALQLNDAGVRGRLENS